MAKAVTFTFDANFSKGKRETDEVTRRLEKQEQTVKALQRELKRMGTQLEQAGEKGRRAGESFSGAFGSQAISQVRSLIGVLAGGGGLLAVYRLITAELERHKELQREQAQAQITLAQAHQDVIRNMPGATGAEIQTVLTGLGTMAGRTNVPERFLAAGMAQALSASGGNIIASQAAVAQAARFLRDRPEMIGGYAGSLLDLSKVTGSTDPRVNMGYLASVAGLSRVVDPAQQAANIPRSLIGQRAFGATAQGAAALFAALTTGAGDITGARTGTAAISLAQQLEEFLPGVPTMQGRIAALQADPTRARRFLGQAAFERVAIGPIRMLLTDPTSGIARQFRANLGRIPEEAGLARMADQAIAARAISPYEPAAETGRVLQDLADQLLLGDVEGGLGGITREGLEKVLRAAGTPGIKAKLKQINWEARTRLGTRQAIGSLIDLLGGEAERLSSAEPIYRAYGPGAMPVKTYHFPTARELEMAKWMEQTVGELQQINAKTRRGGLETGFETPANASPAMAE